MSENSSHDSIYKNPRSQIDSFAFDQSVANVFDDMIRRSVPGYATVINMVGVLAGQYVTPHSVCYDLGCSLGASTLAMRQFIRAEDVRIVAVDNSQAMVQKCRELIAQQNQSVPVEVIKDDINSVDIQQASMVVVNFTLQFVEPTKRQVLLQRIYDGLLDGGVLIVSEKIAFDRLEEQKLQTELHHSFKRLNGYSDLEIAQKRTALENVLIPDTLETHQERLSRCGFAHSHVWFQCFNFASMIAFK